MGLRWSWMEDYNYNRSRNILTTKLMAMENRTLVECDNVNGVKLSLNMQTDGISNKSCSPRSRKFTITYKSERNRNSWARTSLCIAILFNIVIFSYFRINITTFAYLTIIFSFLAFFWITHSVQSETLLVIPTVGLQSSVKYVRGKEDVFITWTSIDDVIINEVIKMNRVLFFLTVLVKPNTELNPQNTVKLVPIFQHTKPRLMMLEKIYSELQVLMREIVRDQTNASGDKG